MIRKYQEIYDIDIEEAEFFFELEKTQTESSGDKNSKIGYFKKFQANNMDLFKNNNYYSYVIEESHIIALDLSRWEIKELPESIGKLSKLQFLSLANLELVNLPESIKYLSHLKSFNLGGNKFNNLPKWLIDFVESKFSQNYINKGVNTIEAKVLSILEVLKGNRLEKVNIICDVIHWEYALNYKINKEGNIIGIYINDEKMGIGIFPELICTLKYLQELVLPQSSLEFLPNCIGELHNLRYLDLSFNRINYIPESINELVNLEYFNLNDNEMSEEELSFLKWSQNGQYSLDKGDYNSVIQECNNTLKIYPKNKSAWFNLGIAYKEVGEYSKAEKALKKFLEIDPLGSVVWSNLSDLYHQMGDYNDAIVAIRQALKIEPNIAFLWSNLGFNYKKLGKYDKAIDAYLYSIDINPKNKNVWKDLASLYRFKGDYMKAIEADEHALEIELYPNDEQE